MGKARRLSDWLAFVDNISHGLRGKQNERPLARGVQQSEKLLFEERKVNSTSAKNVLLAERLIFVSRYISHSGDCAPRNLSVCLTQFR